MNVKKLIARRRGIACACGDWTWDRCYDLKKKNFLPKESAKNVVLTQNTASLHIQKMIITSVYLWKSLKIVIKILTPDGS
jgi:hypothetical protein